jgi:hypothetical protein
LINGDMRSSVLFGFWMRSATQALVCARSFMRLLIKPWSHWDGI